MLIVIPIDAVLNDIVAVVPTPVYLQIQIIFSSPRDFGRKRALADISILPGQRVNVLDGHIVQHDTGCVAGHNIPAFADFLPNNPWDIGHSAQCGLQLLHFVRLDGEVILRQHQVNKVLLFLTLKCDLDFLVHQEISPILAQLFSHAKGVAPTLHLSLTVLHSVVVEAFYIALIPAFPLVHFAVEAVRDGGIAQLIQFDDNRVTHAITPIRREMRSTAYRVASIKWLFSSG